jgi:hypothetical protein
MERSVIRCPTADGATTNDVSFRGAQLVVYLLRRHDYQPYNYAAGSGFASNRTEIAW